MARLIWITLIGILFSLTGHTQTNQRIQSIEYIKQGDKALSMGNWEAALNAYTKAIITDETFSEAYMKRGRLHEKVTHTTQAIADYNMAIQLNPYIQLYYNERARLMMLSSDYTGAVQSLQEGMELIPTSDETEQAKMYSFVGLDMYSEIIQRIKENNDSTKSKSISDLQLIAFAYLQEEDPLSAGDILRTAKELPGDHYLTHDLLGIIYLYKEDAQSALTEFQHSIKLDPTKFISYYNGAIAFRFLEQADSSLAYLNRAIELNTDESLTYYKRALIRKENGQLEQAIMDYDRAIKLDSNFTDALYNRAFTHKLLGNYDQAMKDLDQVIDQKTNEREYWNMKGNLTILFGDYANSLTYFDEAIQSDPKYAEAYYNRGIANLLLNRHIQACDDLQEGARLGFEKAAVLLENFCGI